MPDFHLVEEPDSLVPELRSRSRVGVDTEFMRERTFFAQLCLAQIATPDDIWCVDPLSGHAQEAFWGELLSHDWVLHSARQDIEVVYQTAGAMPASIFDTQVAAALLGFPAQVGYAGLVKELFEWEPIQKVDPTPFDDATPIRPPIASTLRRAISRPRPVPLLDASICDVSTVTKGSKMRGWTSLAIPIPVSATSILSVWPSDPEAPTLRVTAPRSVNLMALINRLSSTCRRRGASPR